MRTKGFTLIEMLIAVALLGVIGLAVIPTDAPQARAKVDVAASELAAALNFARSEALRTGEFHGVNISKSQNRIRVYKLNLATTPPTENYVVYHPLDKKLYDIGLSAAPSTSGVQIVQSDFKFAGPVSVESVTFDRYGAPVKVLDAASSTQLLANSKATVARQGYSREARLDPETGRVTRL